MAAASSLACFSSATARSRCSRPIRAWNSVFSLSARAVRSRTAPLRRSSRSSILPTPRLLLTVLPDFGYELVQLVDHCNRPVHAGQEFFHIPMLEFLALGVLPVALRVLPLGPQFLGDARQPGAARLHGLPSG